VDRLAWVPTRCDTAITLARRRATDAGSVLREADMSIDPITLARREAEPWVTVARDGGSREPTAACAVQD